MIYNQEQVHPFLKDFVRCYWSLENTSLDVLNFTILPDGFFDLIVSYQNHKLESISLSGLMTKEIQVRVKPGQKMFGIQFRLLAVENIIQKSIAPLINQIKILENDFWRLNHMSAKDGLEMHKNLDQHLLSILNSQKKMDLRKHLLLTLINQTKGNQTVDYYSQKVFWSKRQINRYFRATFGLSLKAYCSILKCSASFSQIKNGQLYPDQNYFDQSHFIKDLKKNTGNTPKKLAKNENDRFLQLSIIKKK